MSESLRDENGRLLPGTPKVEGSGRKQGSSKRLAKLLEVLDQESYNPLLELIRVAKDDKTPLETKVQINMNLLQYVYPKKRSIILEGEDSDQSGSVINAAGGKEPDVKKWSEESKEESQRLAEEANE